METPRLGIAMAGLDGERLGLSPAAASDARALIDWVRASGFAAVQLDAAAPGIRPRDLDRSGRRDLAAVLRRADLACAGLDLWIPPEHFVSPAHSDRAVSAVLAAIELASELSLLAEGGKKSPGLRRGASLCLTLPASPPADILGALSAHAARHGVRIADHAWPIAEPEADASPWIGVGVDPAAVLSAGEDPVALAARLGPRLAAARVTDVAAAGPTAGRIPPGAPGGRLDLLAYAASLTIAGYTGWAVLDLRGVPDQAAAAATAQEAWQATAL